MAILACTTLAYFLAAFLSTLVRGSVIEKRDLCCGGQVPIGRDASTVESLTAATGTEISITASSTDSSCLSTTTGTNTWTLGVNGPGAGPGWDRYGTKSEINTFISPCETSYPMAVTQIQTIIATYIPEVDIEGGTTVNTFTWGHFPPSPSYARSNSGGGISCGECPGEDWLPDPKCEELNYKTGCNMQCGFLKDNYVCMQNSTRKGEYSEGRVCWHPDGIDMIFLGEPCHVGDTMAFCTPCKNYTNPDLGGQDLWFGVQDG